MKNKWIAFLALLSAGVGAFESKQDADKKYALFNPALTEEQRVLVQQQMDLLLAKKEGGTQVSSTQIVYDDGAIVITYPVPGVVSDPQTTCDYGYFCVWEHPNYVGRKVSVLSSSNSTVNLADYNMSHQVSSWKYNYRRYAKIVYGVDGANGQGKVMTSTLKEIGNGDECCPFSISEKPEAWTERYFIAHLEEFGDRIVSIKVAPLMEDKD